MNFALCTWYFVLSTLPDHLCYTRFMAANKPTKPKPKPRGGGKNAGKAAPVRGPAAKKTASRAGKTAVKPAAPKKTTASGKKTTAAPPPLVGKLSLDRKLDILGVILALIELLLVLSLVSANRNAVFEGVFNLLARGMGWGGYLLPVVFIGLGLWLILRNFDRVPNFDPERVTGLTLLFFNFVVSLHFFAFPADRAAAYALAYAGGGGGYVGAFISATLVGFLGLWGTVIALFAWLLVSMAFTLDVSVADLFRWVPPFAAAARDRISPLFRQWLSRPAATGVEPLQVFTGDPAPQVVEHSPMAESENGLHFDAIELEPDWALPAMDQVFDQGQDIIHSDEFDRMNARVIEDTLASFGAPAKVIEIKHGPTITMFGVEPDYLENRAGKTRVRVSKIANLADDLSLALAASTIRIQAPVPGEGYIGIEVPNESISLVALRDVIESENFKRMPPPLRFALGQDVSGTPVAANLAAMPHLLIAGATGSGKSVCVNAIICCLLAHNTPDDLRMIMVDPKRVELTNYNGIPHLLAPVVVEMERVVGALQWVTREMDARYQKFHDSRTRNITEFNRMITAKGGKKLPYMVVIIDELADLMLLAPDQTEKAVTRLAQLARATGIHLIIATQRPSVDVVTGLIKANFPARIAFAVASGVDSRVILDQPGADRLLGRGDMLFQAPDSPAPVRLQGVFVSDLEINQLVQFWRMQTIRHADPSTLHSARPADIPAPNIPLRQKPIWEEAEKEANKDPLFDEAVDLIRRQGRASVSMLQRRMRIGYTRAARLIEAMEDQGIVGSPEGGAQTREVLDYGQTAPPAGDN